MNAEIASRLVKKIEELIDAKLNLKRANEVMYGVQTMPANLDQHIKQKANEVEGLKDDIHRLLLDA